MKKIGYIITIIFILCIFLPVHATSDYYKNINIIFNHNGCENLDDKSVTFQLFADGKKVEGQEVTLNKQTGYTYTYQNLPIFKEGTPTEIKYEVKLLENGIYRMISEKNYSYEKKRITGWLQVLPENIKAGHTYVITTDNWNYENNGFSKTIYLRGDITAKGALVEPEFNIIDGNPSYYKIDGDPINNTRWTVSKVPTNDPNYQEYKDYLIFTNESGEKRLTLTGYNNNGTVNFIYKYSGKNGYSAEEDSWNTNRVTLTYVPNSKGRFYIGTHNLWPDGNNNMMQYITLSNQNQYQAGSNMERGAQFKAYEYIDKEVEVGVTSTIEESICPKDEIIINRNSEYKREININLDCNGCESKKDKGITIQLFADGQKVAGEEKTLNSKNGLKHTFKDLPVFYDETYKEIGYEVKIKSNNKYYSIPSKDISHRKINIKKWIQVLPEDIKENNTYLLTTENLNYESNGFSRYIYLRGDITAKGAALQTEYNVINNKKLYYVLDGDPIENTKWTVSRVPNSDPDYSTFKDYLMFTNESGEKKLTLTGYNTGDGINFIYKYSGKNGYIEEEDAMYTNKVQLTNTNSQGKFLIGTKNLYPEPNNMIQYMALSNQNQYQANPNISEATKFIALEYVDQEITVASEIVVKSSLCELLKLVEVKNPKTAFGLYVVFVILLLGILTFIVKESIKEDKKMTIM